jgi:hypothetical protein
MNYSSERVKVLRDDFNRAGREDSDKNIETISLKDVPLKDRRKEAKRPLFLMRYE